MQKNRLIVTIGPSCSGKTGWTERFLDSVTKRGEYLGVTFSTCDWVNINRDDIRFLLFTEGKRDWTRYRFNKANENRVTELEDQLALDAFSEDKNIIVSNTNLNPKYRKKWKDFAAEHGYEYEEKLFPAKWEDLVKRNAQREGGISEHILWWQYKKYMQQFGMIGEHKVIPYSHTLGLPSTVIVDLDGTVACMKGVRKPFDWHLVGEDNPRQAIIDMLGGLTDTVDHITFMSGRDGVCFKDTEAWIKKYVIPYTLAKEYQFVIRPAGDTRKDDVIKYELFDKYVRDKYNVYAALDDRYSVIRLWSILDIPNIIQVGEYQNEF